MNDEIPVLAFEIAKLRLGPDDTLVVKVADWRDTREMNELKERLQQVLNHHKVLVMAGEMELEVLGDE